MLKRFGLVSLLTLLLLAAFFEVGRVRSQSAPRQAFTVSYRTRVDLRAPVHHVYAVRSDGSRAAYGEMELPDHRWVMNGYMLDSATRTRVGVNAATETITTYKISAGSMRTYLSYSAACAGTEHATLLGYELVRVQSDDDPHPPGLTVHRDRWLAPALDCYALSATVTGRKDDGEISGETTEAYAVSEGEPAAYLFRVPTWREVSPSEASAEFARRFPGHALFPAETSTHLDGVYLSKGGN